MITIDTSQEMRLDWAARGSQRRAQNVLNLITTWRYEVAYNRIMGLNPEILDKPLAIAAAMYTADVYRLIQEYEPGVRVKSVKVNSITSDGEIDAEVVIET